MNSLTGLTLIALLAHVGYSEGKLRRVGRVQYYLHTIYALIEPSALWLMDKFLKVDFFTKNRVGNWFFRQGCRTLWYLPHGITLTTESAERLIDYVTTAEGPKGARLAVGPCVCQVALGVRQEPYKKDMVILYGADIYLRHYKDYSVIDAEEGKRLLRECHERGLVHIVDFCMSSGKWTFVVCNCEPDICLITRSYLATGEFVLPGPQAAIHDKDLCLGVEECGRCLDRCIFKANVVSEDGKPSIIEDKCMGCGLCVTTCPPRARRITERADFKHSDKISCRVLAGVGNPTDAVPL